MRQPVLARQVLGPQQFGRGLVVLAQSDESLPVHGELRWGVAACAHTINLPWQVIPANGW
jgi:hypothetical protein